MGYIPKNAQWYLADVIEAISVEGDARVVVHINSLLVRADSPGEAHARATALGRKAGESYRNAVGAKVTVRFLGMRELNVLHDGLEHGAEILYRKRMVRSLDAAKKLVRPKRRLGVFAPRRASGPPDIVSAAIHAGLVEAGATRPRYGTARSRQTGQPAARRSKR